MHDVYRLSMRPVASAESAVRRILPDIDFTIFFHRNRMDMENIDTERKESWTSECIKTIAAFHNTLLVAW